MVIEPGFQALLASYPRVRPPLSPAQQQSYVNDYQTSRDGTTLVTSIVLKMEAWMHRTLAARKTGDRILELGAGTLNHLPYEQGYKTYDFIEPFEELWRNRPNLNLTTNQYRDIAEVPADKPYDRVISIAVLEHLTSLPQVVARAALLLSKNGQFQAGIPSEGGFLWGTAWRCTTAPAYRLRTGMKYKALMQHEHVNTASEIVAVVRHLFENVEVLRFPVPVLHLSLYTCIIARNPRLELCREILARTDGR